MTKENSLDVLLTEIKFWKDNIGKDIIYHPFLNPGTLPENRPKGDILFARIADVEGIYSNFAGHPHILGLRESSGPKESREFNGTSGIVVLKRKDYVNTRDQIQQNGQWTYWQ
jgi:hypothetical protein